jgi:excinuclease ABC subunit C
VDLKTKVKLLPAVPGVYKFKNEHGEIIYIGKAKSLKHRVKSYFVLNLDINSKTYQLVQHIHDLEYIEVFSELEALILEASLIKKHLPKYNILLKDDKSYIYIVIDKGNVIKNGRTVSIPRVLLARERDLLPATTYYGPFTSAEAAKSLHKTIRKVLPFRDCDVPKFEKYRRAGRPCLYGFIGLCPAPCVNADITSYKNNIAKIKKILNGQTNALISDLNRQMTAFSKQEEFESAGSVRDLLKKFTYAKETFRVPQSYIDNPYLVQDIIDQSLSALVSAIPILKTAPWVIECYDISNLSGKEAVGSLVCAVGGRITKAKYKKFKIKLKSTPDDFSMLAEVLTRRLMKGIQGASNWELPDLLIIDGGKGQVSTILEVLEKLELTIPVVGLAKKDERLIYHDGTSFVEVTLDRSNEGLKLAQRLRDEAHRFARAYHHKLRVKSIEDQKE